MKAEPRTTAGSDQDVMFNTRQKVESNDNKRDRPRDAQTPRGPGKEPPTSFCIWVEEPEEGRDGRYDVRLSIPPDNR